ncbi:MAG: MFS transporter [Aquincola sp.]|nr:MFS transporter [Aquincola sp.]
MEQRIDMRTGGRRDGRRWLVLAAGFAGNAVFSATISGLPAAAVPLRAAYGLDTSGLGIAIGAVGLGIALSELPWGLLTDRLGDRRVLLWGLGLTAAVLAWLSLFVSPAGGHRPSLAALATGMALIGLAGGSVNGASGRAVMLWFSDRERGLAMSIRQTALPVGGALGALAVPAVAVEAGFGAAFAVLAVACMAAGAACWWCLRQPPPAAAQAMQDQGAAAAASPLRRWATWRLVLAIGALCVGQIAVLSFLAVFLHDVGRFSIAQTSAAMFLYQAGAATLRVWSGAWTDRHGNRPAFLQRCCLLVAVLFGVLALLAAWAVAVGGQGGPAHALSRWALWGLLVLAGMLASAWHGVAFTELAVQAGLRHVGTALGLGNTLAFSAYFLTPLMVPLALRLGGWPAAWGLAAACALLARPLFGQAGHAGTHKPPRAQKESGHKGR